MSTVSDILQKKGPTILTIAADASVLEAVQLMNEHRVGSIVVTEPNPTGGEKLIGIFTERDLMRRVVGDRRDPESVQVGDVMTAGVVCCEMATTIDEARGVMKRRRIRHLPVVDAERRIMGLISIGDLSAHQMDGQEQTIHYLEEYIYGASATPATPTG